VIVDGRRYRRRNRYLVIVDVCRHRNRRNIVIEDGFSSIFVIVDGHSSRNRSRNIVIEDRHRHS